MIATSIYGASSSAYCDRLPLRALRANRDFCADEKHIRAEIAVMDKSKGGSGWFLYKIDDPRGRFFVRAKSQLCNIEWREFGRHAEAAPVSPE